MSSHFPGKHFRLPGLRQGSTLERRLTIAITAAYSTRYNQRRLEYPFYAVWDVILTAMISDLGPNVYLAPQFELDGLVPPSTNDEGLALSMTKAHAHERIPDFVVLADYTLYRTPHASASIRRWRRIIVVLRQFLILVEGKRPPTRRAKKVEYFEKDLKDSLQEAQRDLYYQASKVFEGHRHMQRLMLVAFSGTWWSWMICTREGCEDAIIILDRLNEEENTFSSLGEEESYSEFDPAEEEVQMEKEKKLKKKKKKGKRRAVEQLGPTEKLKQLECAVESPSATLDQSSSDIRLRSGTLAYTASEAGPSRQPATNVQAEWESEIEPFGPRRSTRIRQPTKKFEPPSGKALRTPVVPKPQTRSNTRYYHHLDNMEESYQTVSDAVTIRTNAFSEPILLGSSISNQALYITHDWLEKEIDRFAIHPGAINEETPQDIDGSLSESDSIDGSDCACVHSEFEDISASETEGIGESEVGPEETEEESAVNSDGEHSWDDLSQVLE